MAPDRLPWVVAAVGVASGWCAARYAAFSPLLWLVLLVVVFALAPSERRLMDQRWLFAGLLLIVVSWVVAADHEGALRHSLLFLAAAVLFGLARRAVPDDRVMGLVALGLALTAVVAFAQTMGGLEKARGFVNTLPVPWQEAALIRLDRGRAFATSTLPGHYAALLLLAAPLVAERGWRAAGWRRAGWGTVLVALSAAVALTRSLAALVVAGLLLIPLVWRNLRSPAVRVAVGLLAVVAAFTLATRSDLLRLEPIQLRWVNWQTTAWVLVHHPFLGVGLGGVGQAGLLAPTAGANITPFTHNSYLQLLAEFGFAGLGLLVAGAWGLVRLLRAGGDAYPGLTLSVAVLPLHNLMDFSAYAPEVLLPWAVLAGALAGRVFPPPAHALHRSLLLPLLGCGTLLAVLAWRSEVELTPAFSAPPAQGVEAALAAARWAPWTVTPLEAAASLAVQGGARTEVLGKVDGMLASRAWVRPLSASWAEARCRLLVRQGRLGEALVWAREARCRAPWREGLAELEAACSVAR